MTDNNRPISVDAVLATIENTLTLDIPDDCLIAPAMVHDNGTLAHELAMMVSPWNQILRAVIDQPKAEDVDGIKPGHLDPEPAQSIIFEAAYQTDDSGDEDDAPTMEVITEYTNSYGTQRAIIQTPKPWFVPDNMTPPNEVVKSLPWDDTDAESHDSAEKGIHYSFNDGDADAPPEAEKAWTIDAHGVDALRQEAQAEGYDWVDNRTPNVTDTVGGFDDLLDEVEGGDGLDYLLSIVEPGDTLTVRYLKKTGSGIGSKSGKVTHIAPGGKGRIQGLSIKRDDDQYNNIKRDDEGTPSIFSQSQYPFMGVIVSVEVVPDSE